MRNQGVGNEEDITKALVIIKQKGQGVVETNKGKQDAILVGNESGDHNIHFSIFEPK